MPADYSSTARALALPVSPTRSPNSNHQPIRTSWTRSQSNVSRGRSQSPYGTPNASLRDRIIDSAEKLSRRVINTVRDLSPLQRVLASLFVIVSLTLTILFFIFHGAIFTWLQPIAEKWKSLKGGWLILWAMTFITAFPPVIGYATCVTLAGFVYGFPDGYVFGFLILSVPYFHSNRNPTPSKLSVRSTSTRPFSDLLTVFQLVYRRLSQYPRLPLLLPYVPYPLVLLHSPPPLPRHPLLRLFSRPQN